MKNLIFRLFILFSLCVTTSCKQENRSGEDDSVQPGNNTTVTVPNENGLGHCYAMISGEDTAEFKIRFSGDSVAGRLEYR